MRYIKGDEARETWKYIEEAAKEAEKSTCKSSHRGSVIVRDGKIVGRGYNKPTVKEYCDSCLRENIEGMQRVELCRAIHAEQMALLNCKKEDRMGSTLYHVRVKDGKITPSKEPVCTVCSRMIKEAEIRDVVLYEKDGLVSYDAKEFNEKSFENVLRGSLLY